MRPYLPDLTDLVLIGAIDPGKFFDLTLPLEQAVESYRPTDTCRVIKALLCP